MRTEILIGLPLLAVLLAACGGDQVAGGGTGGTGMVAVRGQVASSTPKATGVQALAGVSAGAQNIVINGITYDMSNASYTGARDINPGMVVTLVASNNAGTRAVQSAFYVGELKGPVDHVVKDSAAAAGSFIAMGHTVFWDDRTQRNHLVLEDLAPQSCVEVSGFSMGDKRIHATYVVAASDCDAEVEVMGFVTETTPQLQLNTVLTVVRPAGFDEVLKEGVDVVTVKGAFTAPASVEATSIEKLKSLGELDHRAGEAEVEGLVSGVQAFGDGTPVSFFVAGQPVRLTSSTEYSGGMAQQITNGVHLEAEGPLKRAYDAGAYYLEATEIEFKDEIEIVAQVESVAADALTFFGGAMTIDVTAATRFEGIDRTAIAHGTCLEVRARRTSGNAVATQAKQEGCEDEVKLRGPATDIDRASGTFQILGMPVNANAIEEFEYDDRPLSRDQFLDLLSAGDLVELEGSAGPNWDKAELDD
ncbi:MAG: DUF5666 domain-containing protein [Gammaproteobacteria bacterium]|nr:DUF5666 domain-containing protein [Gammaproteobacteria bacterium]